MKLSEEDRQMVIGALDTLGVLLSDSGHVFTEGDRAIYENAVKILGISDNEFDDEPT